jgi:deazaflavin-dependent oxidoreductase (nitroreductase family)
VSIELGATHRPVRLGSLGPVSLIDRLGYSMPEPNRLQRLIQGVASSRLGGSILSRTLMPVDMFLGRLSGAGTSVPGILAGLPVVTVTTIGRRSGQERQVALLAIPFQDTLALIGTNWGRAKTPGWVLNLENQPLARIEYKGTTCAVAARAVEGAEHSEVMTVAARHYRGYLEYQRRITNRPIRIFSLHPVDD